MTVTTGARRTRCPVPRPERARLTRSASVTATFSTDQSNSLATSCAVSTSNVEFMCTPFAPSPSSFKSTSWAFTPIAAASAATRVPPSTLITRL
jgi:hypothetical protein